jgi:hypothetical protein
VRMDVAMRRDLCRVWNLCRALGGLCRASMHCHAPTFAVSWLLPCAGLRALPCAPTLARTAKTVGSNPISSQVVQGCTTWGLCRVYAHGKVTKWSFAVCIHTAKTPHFSRFFLFFFNSLHFKITSTYI